MSAGCSLASRHFQAKMHTANAATASKLACEPVGMAYTTVNIKLWGCLFWVFGIEAKFHVEFLF